MTQMVLKKSTLTLSMLLLLVLMLPSMASATGPRVTKALFSIDKAQIHALDFPPFLSNEVKGGGAFSEIVNTALQQAGIDAVISTHPLQRIVKYYLLQEQALAIMGCHLSFSDKTKKELIFIPVSIIVEKFYYYKPTYPNGLGWNGQLSTLKGKIYGAHKGEDVSSFKAVGVSVKWGRTIALLKKIAAEEVDFAAVPAPTADWLLDKFMVAEKDNFAAMKSPAGKDIMYVVFNKKHPQGIDAAVKFRKALRSMVDDGAYAAIVKKYFGNSDMLKLYMGDLKDALSQ